MRTRLQACMVHGQVLFTSTWLQKTWQPYAETKNPHKHKGMALALSTVAGGKNKLAIPALPFTLHDNPTQDSPNPNHHRGHHSSPFKTPSYSSNLEVHLTGLFCKRKPLPR